MYFTLFILSYQSWVCILLLQHILSWTNYTSLALVAGDDSVGLRRSQQWGGKQFYWGHTPSITSQLSVCGHITQHL